MNNNYNADSIETLNFVDAVRKRIEMYMGSADNQGVLQCIREVISNSIDEYSIGYGNKIEITVDTDKNIFTCRDYARSIPFGKRSDGTEAMIATFMLPHTGGKFNDKQYGNAIIGQNGIGVKGVALSAENFKACSYRDGECATLILHRGQKINYVVTTTKEPNGTYIEFSPSLDVYRLEEIHMSFQDICHMCEDWSYLNKGLTFIIKDIKNNKTITYYSENGISDFIKSKLKSNIQKEPYIYSLEDDKGNKVEIGFLWGSKSEMSFVFTNGLHNLNGGTSLTGAKMGITRTMNQLLNNNLSGDFVRNNLCYVINAKVPHASFSDQTKMKINNIELRPLADKAFSEGLKKFANTHKDEFNTIIELLKKLNRAEIAADKARAKILQASNEIEKNQKRKVFASDKLKDAEFLGQDSILLIVEGNSAASSIVKARDYTKYGVLAIRGKIINALSNTEEDIFENEEIKLLLSAMNIIPGKYDSRKLRYGRIGICVDADSDGYHIALLIMSVLQYLAPQFIQEDRLCWLRSPLYIVKNGKQEQYFFTDNDFEKVRKTIKGEINRAKGLGALSVDQAHNSMFAEKYQRLDVLHPTENAIQLLYNLMGPNPKLRKEFIFNNVDFSEVRE